MSYNQKTNKTTKGQVSPRALMQRINRALANEGQALKATRRERWQRELGDHFIVDTNLNIVVVQHCELDTLGTELGVLKEFETIALT